MTVALLGKPSGAGLPSGAGVRELVLYWMQEWVWRGFPTDDAAVKTLAEVRAAGLVEEFLDELGPMACQDFWRHGQRQVRDGRIYAEVDAQEDAGDGERSEPDVIEIRGTSLRAPGNILSRAHKESLFDWMMVRVGGVWRSIGDLHRGDAELVAADFAKRKNAMAGKEETWLRIARELGDKPIRERYSEDEIRVLLRGVR